MNTIKTIRKIDTLGRIVIPKEIRHQLQILDNDCLEIKCNDKQIIISKANNQPYQQELTFIKETCTKLYHKEILLINAQQQVNPNFRKLCMSYHKQSFNAYIYQNNLTKDQGILIPLWINDLWIVTFVIINVQPDFDTSHLENLLQLIKLRTT